MENKAAGAQLSGRWDRAACFVILDARINGALNFFTAWSAWRADPARPARLHYLLLVERASSLLELVQKCADSPQLHPLAQELRSTLPPLVPGFHRLLLDGGRVALTLMIGDARTCLSQSCAQVDLFLVDGALCSHEPKKISRLAAPDAMLMSDMLPPDAQQVLAHAGFIAVAAGDLEYSARFAPRWAQPASGKVRERKAIVIGAGLAGSAACERLAAHDWHVTLIERHAQPAQEASGNLAGIAMPLLSKDDNATARLTRAAYFFAAQTWRRIGGIGNAFSGEMCGVLQLARDAEHAQNQQQMMRRWDYPDTFVQWLDVDRAAKLLGQAVPDGGLYFPQAGWAHPPGVCRALLAACTDRVESCFTQSAIRLQRVGAQWQVHDTNGALLAQAPVVILANGVDAVKFEQAAHLPLTSVRGQVSHVAADSLPDLTTVVCRDGYVTRPSEGICSVGASYDLDDDPMPRPGSDADNLARLHQMLPQLSVESRHLRHPSRVGFRCVAPDRLPLVGALPDAVAEFHGDRLRDVPRLPGLYGLLGYASRGLIWSSFAAELLTAQLEAAPLPVENDLVEALDPARFLLKAHRKKGRVVLRN